MHVLYVIDSLVAAGAERSLVSLARPYKNAGIQLDVAYLLDRPGLQNDLLEAGAEVFCLAGQGGRTAALTKVRRLIRARRPDLVHTTLFEADIAGRLAARSCRVPVVSSLVSVPYGRGHFSDPRLKRWRVHGAHAVDAATSQLVVRFHANSRHVADTMAGRLKVPASRIDVVPRGRDPEELGERSAERRCATRDALGIGEEDMVVLTAARHEYQKGLDIVLRALPSVLAQFGSVKLLIAGREGHQTAGLASLVERLEIQESVRLLGPRTDVPDLLVAADLFVLPSRWEGFPGVLLEAMALETPILAVDVPGVGEVMGNEGPALVPPEDPEALGAAISKALSELPAASAITGRLRQRFLDRFTNQRVGDEMVAFYQRALSSAR